MKGFSLVELLVTVTIIGLIATMAISQFAKYREKVFDAVTISDLRNTVIAYNAYKVDNNVPGQCTELNCVPRLISQYGLQRSDSTLYIVGSDYSLPSDYFVFRALSCKGTNYGAGPFGGSIFGEHVVHSLYSTSPYFGSYTGISNPDEDCKTHWP